MSRRGGGAGAERRRVREASPATLDLADDLGRLAVAVCDGEGEDVAQQVGCIGQLHRRVQDGRRRATAAIRSRGVSALIAARLARRGRPPGQERQQPGASSAEQ